MRVTLTQCVRILAGAIVKYFQRAHTRDIAILQLGREPPTEQMYSGGGGMLSISLELLLSWPGEHSLSSVQDGSSLVHLPIITTIPYLISRG